MGGGQSYEKEYRDTQRELEEIRRQKEAAIEERKKLQRKKEKAEAENRAKELQRQNEGKEKELKRAKEETERLQEAHRKQAEKDKALAEKHEKEMQRASQEREDLRKESERLQKEKDIIQAENYEKELKKAEEEKANLQEAYRIQAEKDRALTEKHEKEMRRAEEERVRLQKENHEKELKRMKEEKEEEKKKIEEAHRMQEELRKLQEKIRMEEERRKMEELARRTEEEAKKRVEQEIWLRKEAERNLEAGIPAVKYPTGEEFQATRERLGYQEGNLHVAITGVSGSGKSSLINAVRGCPNRGSKSNMLIAKTGTSETTEETKRYPDPSREWLVWYDVPGAGTVKVRDWQYFNNQGLYIFDAIIIVIGDRFTSTDVELLFHCKRFGIPGFVVRSKADQHIQNNMNEDCDEDGSDDGDDDDDDESNDEDRKKNRLMRARDKYIKDTRKDFESLLQTVGLPQQKVYIVDRSVLRSLIKNLAAPESNIDEAELMRDIVHAVSTRHLSK